MTRGRPGKHRKPRDQMCAIPVPRFCGLEISTRFWQRDMDCRFNSGDCSLRIEDEESELASITRLRSSFGRESSELLE